MCGRYVLALQPVLFPQAYGLDAREGYLPRYNITPGIDILTLRAGQDGERCWAWQHWGLVPPWAAGPSDRGKQINARSETAHQKPMFRDAFKRRRCLVPAEGYYEWAQIGPGKKQPLYCHIKGAAPMAFAAIWHRIRLPDDSVCESVAILTAAAEGAMAGLHPRMPLMLPADRFDAWLDPARQKADEIHAIMQGFGEADIVWHEVSTAVNSIRSEGPGLIAPLERQPEPVQPSLF